MSSLTAVLLVIMNYVNMVRFDKQGKQHKILYECCAAQLKITSFHILQVESTQSMIRIVGLSATLPNYLEV